MQNTKTFNILKEKYDQFCAPDYKQDNICHIPQHLLFLQGLENTTNITSGNSSKLDTRITILFVLDGLGLRQWNENTKTNPIMQLLSHAGNFHELTTMFPSSTAVSLNALHTGLTTQQHGLIEWWMYDKQSDQTITTLPFMPIGSKEPDSMKKYGVKPEKLLNSKTVFEKLADGGIHSYTLISNLYSESSYSRLAYKGSTLVPFSDIEDLFSKFTKLVNSNEKCHINIYWSEIDFNGHKFGPDSKQYRKAISTFFNNFEKSLKEINTSNSETAELMITSDHGQIEIDPNKTIWLNNYSKLNDNLALSSNNRKILPWGIHRDVYIKVEESKIDETHTFLKEVLNNKALIFNTDELLADGIFGFGSLHPEFKDRIGDLLILPTGNNTVWYKHYENENFDFRGVHGGLTKSEVEVPFISTKLKKILKT